MSEMNASVPPSLRERTRDVVLTCKCRAGSSAEEGERYGLAIGV